MAKRKTKRSKVAKPGVKHFTGHKCIDGCDKHTCIKGILERKNLDDFNMGYCPEHMTVIWYEKVKPKEDEATEKVQV